MPILTIDLPEEAYQNALALPVAERERMVANVFTTARNLPGDDDLTQEDRDAIREGLADLDAGRVHDGDTVLAELRAMVGL